MSQIPAGQEYVLVSKWSSFPSEKAYLFAYYHDGSRTTLALGTAENSTSDDREVYVPYTLPVGQWNHVAVVFLAASGSARFFVNGASVGSAFGLGTTINAGNGVFQIGTRNGLAVTAFDGFVDEVRVWNRARTPTEIAQNYNLPISSPQSGLVGYWQFECNSGDSTENNNGLTLIGSPTFVTDVPFGFVGSACN
jgi:hypothetical protein